MSETFQRAKCVKLYAINDNVRVHTCKENSRDPLTIIQFGIGFWQILSVFCHSLSVVEIVSAVLII